MYLMWFDPARNKSPARKIAEAADRYRGKFGHDPTAVLCNPADATADATVQVYACPFIGRHHYWIGIPEGAVPRCEAVGQPTPGELGAVPAGA